MNGDKTSDHLNITFVGVNYGPETTGIAPYTQGMAQALRNLGHRVRVITSYPSYPAWKVTDGYRGLTMSENINSVTVKRLRTVVPAEPTPVRRVLMEVLFGFRAALQSFRGVDVVVCVSPALLASVMVHARLLLTPAHRRPTVGYWVQDLYGLGIEETGQDGGAAAEIVSAAESWGFRQADGVAVIHERFAHHLVTRLGVRKERVEIVQNWSHIVVPVDLNIESMRRRFGWGEEETVVLHAGNMGVKQGLESVVEAARLAAERELPIRFVLLGDGNQRARLEDMAVCCNRIQFIPPVGDEEFPAILSAADILLLNELPTVSEMCVPSKLTSYFAVGRPVLAATSPRGVSAEVLDKSDAALVVAPGQPEALIDGASHLASDPRKLQAMGDRGRRFSDALLGDQAAVTKFDSWVRSMFERPGR